MPLIPTFRFRIQSDARRRVICGGVVLLLPALLWGIVGAQGLYREDGSPKKDPTGPGRKGTAFHPSVKASSRSNGVSGAINLKSEAQGLPKADGVELEYEERLKYWKAHTPTIRISAGSLAPSPDRLLLGKYNLGPCWADIIVGGKGPFAQESYFAREMSLRFKAVHQDQSPAGQFFDAPGGVREIKPDDDKDGPSIPFKADDRMGPVRIWVEVLDREGKEICRSKPAAIFFDDVKVEQSASQWRRSRVAGQWTRDLIFDSHWASTASRRQKAPSIHLSVHIQPPKGGNRKITGLSGNEVDAIDLQNNGQPTYLQQVWIWDPEITRQTDVYGIIYKPMFGKLPKSDLRFFFGGTGP